jgi:ankyrin repeat protein
MFSLRASPAAVPASVSRGRQRASQSARTLSSPSLVVSSSALLFVAAKAGDADQVRRLVESLGSGTDAASLRNAAQMSQTPLHVTASVACARLLTARLPGLVDVADDDGALPLHTAIRQMRFEVALHLLGLPGADAQCGRGRCRAAPLHLLGGVPWTGQQGRVRVCLTRCWRSARR